MAVKYNVLSKPQVRIARKRTLNMTIDSSERQRAMVQPAHLAVVQEVPDRTTKSCVILRTAQLLTRWRNAQIGRSYASQRAIRPIFARCDSKTRPCSLSVSAATGARFSSIRFSRRRRTGQAIGRDTVQDFEEVAL
ncbi:hypothetical protein DPMN_118923 [Dreissena polymorpha]|uniref:Uncharacterized protein n=1 Tax=Dreissena polymorpha TaxID=45954 RepID=A0A9D4GHQ7_DREPO|nr:hypothetical protein DPMN_118923 [Dreissena polymorpha]